jgi:hypothetical protein
MATQFDRMKEYDVVALLKLLRFGVNPKDNFAVGRSDFIG